MPRPLRCDRGCWARAEVRPSHVSSGKSWSCPEGGWGHPGLQGVGRPKPQGAWGHGGILTVPDLLLLFMALCCFLVPRLWSVPSQPRLSWQQWPHPTAADLAESPCDRGLLGVLRARHWPLVTLGAGKGRGRWWVQSPPVS